MIAGSNIYNSNPLMSWKYSPQNIGSQIVSTKANLKASDLRFASFSLLLISAIIIQYVYVWL